MRRVLAHVLAPVLACLMLAGCSAQRPLYRVEKDGDYNLKTEQYALAADDFAEYVQRKPYNVEVRYKLAKSLIADKRPREALSHLTICTDVEPLNDRYLDAQAQALFDAGQKDELVSILARAASERGRVTDYLRLGIYAQNIGNLDEARQALLTAAKLDQGRSVKVQRALADFYGSVGNHAEQVRRIRMAYFLQPDNLETIEAARALGEVPGPTFGLVPEEMRMATVPTTDAR
jgi:tetratricopeptide (TPR) repeat protein